MGRILFFILLLWAHISVAKIWTPTILSDNMVLQQQSTATIWGWTTATSETITITGSWNNEAVTAKAHQGVWSAQLPTPIAGGPYTLTIKGHEEITFSNVMIGEVWIASGQSNMQWTPNMGLDNAQEEIEQANFPKIRFFQVPQWKSTTPQDDSPGEWMSCSPETMQNFSSVAYFFGRKLHKGLSVPIGLISSNWGGTPVEVWIPKDLIEGNSGLNAAAKKLSEFEWWPEQPGVTYNAMIHPLLKFNIAGAIWYQGESNRDNAISYYESFPLLIDSWRAGWKKEFPFYFAQIAPFDYDKDKKDIKAAVVRDAQLYTMQSVPKTGMAVTNDIGNLKDIHPTNKQEVGRRLALWALAKTYGVKDVAYSGPVYKEMEVKKNKIVLTFDHAKNGLKMDGKELKEFYIAGADKKFYEAKARIKGNLVEVSSKKVKAPVAVRFAFYDKALPNLYNAEGLPASGFRTDQWELNLD
ncbi:sialate O-acetylesterase [Flagellimonas myxillae]|uniref:sialate O-acetylesterase n=1 Tax=Flagellimonas myxillae TaxID=2942214 RepID=UPI00201F22E4|nr:sialate O-acetylesterase [Muricauda myxillae]MCL6267923.1 sialate O-acetylesterase [Muricauda myxillae]